MDRELVELVWRRANAACEYCRMPQDYDALTFEIHHVVATIHGGMTVAGNFALACFLCNNFKQAQTQALDVRSGRLVPLFHPRTDAWSDHFRWSRNQTRVVGRSPVGRATIEALRLNRPALVRARTVWVRHGLHPPES